MKIQKNVAGKVVNKSSVNMNIPGLFIEVRTMFTEGDITLCTLYCIFSLTYTVFVVW